MTDERKVIAVNEANASSWSEALDVVGETIIADEKVRGAVRDICWWLTEEHHTQILGNARLDEDPVRARIAEMYLRGVAAGVGMACEHLTDSDRVREVRAWIEGSKEAKR